MCTYLAGAAEADKSHANQSDASVNQQRTGWSGGRVWNPTYGLPRRRTSSSGGSKHHVTVGPISAISADRNTKASTKDTPPAQRWGTALGPAYLTLGPQSQTPVQDTGQAASDGASLRPVAAGRVDSAQQVPTGVSSLVPQPPADTHAGGSSGAHGVRSQRHTPRDREGRLLGEAAPATAWGQTKGAGNHSPT